MKTPKLDLIKLLNKLISLDNTNVWVKAFSRITNMFVIMIILIGSIVLYQKLGTPPDEGYSPLERRLMHNKIRLMSETRGRSSRWLAEDELSDQRSRDSEDIFTPSY